MSDSSRTAARSIFRRCWPVLAAVPLGAVCGGAYALAAPAQYQANAYVMVVPGASGDSSTALNFAQAYGRVIAQPEILQSASTSTGVPLAKLTPLIEAVTSPDAPMIQITGTSGGAAKAAQEANAVARSLVAFGNNASAQTGVKLLTFASAARPDAPSSPSRTLDVAVGAAAGLLVGGLGMLAGQSRPGEEGAAPLPLPRSNDPRNESRAGEEALVPAGTEAPGPDSGAGDPLGFADQDAGPGTAARRTPQGAAQGRR